ncbi:hypothetical protein B0A55_08848 [Friedmanniomyces simplex]|uniref:Delta 8-(E)-sphingolipid desaturase n=1 Tax=Friedmanniomyces simplex TaxID=329884 RepID=A0A4U0X683_9PEZI|nr:hypothetical protein B0A55_08848 [Friedmanniomyces simplex]
MAAPQHTSRYRDRTISRNEVEALIAEGRKIVIVDGRVLKTDAWLPYHPGGDKAILHMVGRDGTNEVKAFHSAGTLDLMLRYQIGKIEGQWRDFVPPIQGGVFRSREQQGARHSPVNSTHEEVETDSSDPESSEPSPMFEPVERSGSGPRRRRGSNGAASDSSATSVSDLELEAPAVSSDKLPSNDAHTQQELINDLEKYPNLDPQTQADIIAKYKQLDQRLRDEKLYDCNYRAYAIEITRYTALALLSYYCLQTGYYALSALFLGMLWHQLVFTVHDAGHMGITHDFHTDTCLSILVADFIGGLSACWWKRNHNVHHIVTNSAEHDPDIQHLPFFAISPKFFRSLTSTYYDRVMSFDALAKVALKYQHWLYYPILTFGRFNLYVLSWQYILLGQGPRKGPAWWHRYLEAVGQVFFWYWFGYLLLYKSLPSTGTRVLYVMISHAVTMPVHVQITLSHFAMSTADLGVAESFPQRMLRTTMDVACPAWLDFFHGGLQFQAVHHLFPRMPRHNLRKAQKLVMQFCEEVEIPYAVYGFAEGNGKVIGRLGEVARQARVLAECSRSMTAGDVFEAH